MHGIYVGFLWTATSIWLRFGEMGQLNQILTKNVYLHIMQVMKDFKTLDAIKTKRHLAVVLLVISTVFLFASCYNSNMSTFNGNRVGNDDYFAVDCTMMNCKEIHTISMEEGDDFQVVFEVVSGEMNVAIKAPSGAIAYKGNGVYSSRFRVTALETGEYEITLDAKKFKGSVSFTKVKK